MNKIIPIILCFLFLYACRNNTANKVNKSVIDTSSLVKNIPELNIDTIEGAYLKLDKKKYDFGKIIRNTLPAVRINFEVFNSGKSPLIIHKVDVSCGCLSVDFPQQPILSGEKAQLTIIIDTRKQDGAFNKTVFIKSNALNDIELIRIVGKIKGK